MMDYTDELKILQDISDFAGNRPDYTQGGGGNTSVKLDARLMAIKASGYRLTDITPTTGFVTVDYPKLLNYYSTVDPAEDKDFEAESAKVAQEAVDQLPGLPALRPSVEVGFHSLLKKYVIHTHAVYANLLCCTSKGEELAREIFADADFGVIWLPYIKPGFTLTLKMAERIRSYRADHGEEPSVIFMQNHGLVVHDDDPGRAKQLQAEVNDRIMAHFGLTEKDFGKVALKKEGEGFVSASAQPAAYLKHSPINLVELDRIPLYPDQLVYLNNTLRNDPSKMEVKGERVFYRTTEKEATTLEETLCAYLFVVDQLRRHNLPISVMGGEDVDFINHWEAEKFRRTVSK